MVATMRAAVTHLVMLNQLLIGASNQVSVLMRSSIDLFSHSKSAQSALNNQSLRTFRAASTFSASKPLPWCALSRRVSRVWPTTSSTVCSKRRQMQNSSRLEMMKYSPLPASHSCSHQLTTVCLSARRLATSLSSISKVRACWSMSRARRVH